MAGRGILTVCRCGQPVVLRTSKTVTNPGRILSFHKDTARRRKDMTSKMRGEPCNFCEFSSSRYRCGSEQDQEHDNEAVLREEVQKLRSQLMKMTGRDDDVSFTELQALKSRLLDAMRIVLDQKQKKEREEEEQKKKAEDEDGGTRREVWVPRTSRHEKQDNGASMVRVFTSGPPLDNGALMSKLERKFETRKSESLQRKFERLWLFNERMNGREIESMTSHDLLLLDSEIL